MVFRRLKAGVDGLLRLNRMLPLQYTDAREFTGNLLCYCFGFLLSDVKGGKKGIKRMNKERSATEELFRLIWILSDNRTTPHRTSTPQSFFTVSQPPPKWAQNKGINACNPSLSQTFSSLVDTGVHLVLWSLHAKIGHTDCIAPPIRLDGRRLHRRSKLTGLDPRWLRLAAFQPLFQQYFESLFETAQLPPSSFLRTPPPMPTPSEEEEEIAEWEKRMEEAQPIPYEACAEPTEAEWQEWEKTRRARRLRSDGIMVGPLLESRDSKAMDDFAQRLAGAWLLPESPFDAFNPKIKRLEPDVPMTWPLRDEFR